MIRRRASFPALALFLASAIAAAACARLPPPLPATALPAEDRAALEEAERTLRRKEGELSSAHAGKAPDCPRACALAADVCALAERICALVARLPPGDPMASRCAEGRSRCLRARDEAASRCGCPAARPRAQ